MVALIGWPSDPPRLETDRLVLRPLRDADAAAVQRVCEDPLVAWGADGVDLPYTMSMARVWILHAREQFDKREMIALGVALASSDEIIGDVCLEGLASGHAPALGYIIGAAHRGQGYATEAARRLVRYAFEELALTRLTAQSFDRNDSSKRVLGRVGFRVLRVRQRAVRRGDVLEDDVDFVLTREEWIANRRTSVGRGG